MVLASVADNQLQQLGVAQVAAHRDIAELQQFHGIAKTVVTACYMSAPPACMCLVDNHLPAQTVLLCCQQTPCNIAARHVATHVI